MLLTLRIVHDLAATIWVGSVIFNYFLLRPALTLIPPAHAVVVLQQVGTLFLYTGWTALGLLFLSGALRLTFFSDPWAMVTPGMYVNSYVRSVAVMVFFWLVTVVNVAIITWLLRPRLIRKLSADAQPRLADVEKRRLAQLASSAWLDRLNLINVITSTLALIAGASIGYGGLF